MLSIWLTEGRFICARVLMNYGANTEKDMHNKTVFDYLNVKNEYYSMIHSILRK